MTDVGGGGGILYRIYSPSGEHLSYSWATDELHAIETAVVAGHVDASYCEPASIEEMNNIYYNLQDRKDGQKNS